MIDAQPPAKARWVEIDLGPTGVEQLNKAIIALTFRKYGGKSNAPQLLFEGDGRKIQFCGDAEAIRWVTELVENLKK